MNITHLLTIKKDDLITILRSTSTKSGAHSFLFTPERKENKVCLVAHIDTVWDKKAGDKTKSQSIKETKLLLHDTKKGLIYSPQGLGADDRAGVYGVLKLLTSIPEPFTPYVLLTDLEESGGAGAEEATELYKEELANCTMFVELDRKGTNDCVFYSSEPDDFIKYIEGFGFKESTGSFSDISIISPEFGRCAVNLSIGYHNEHTLAEYLDLHSMESTIKKVKKLVIHNTKESKHWTHIAPPSIYGAWGKEWASQWDELIFKDDYLICPKCDEWMYKDEVEDSNGKCITCNTKLDLLNVGI